MRPANTPQDGQPDRRLSVHYYTDCAYFAGCENMLAVFFASSELKERYRVSLGYRFSERYREGLERRVALEFPVYRLFFPDIFDFTLLSPRVALLLRRLYFFAVRLVGIMPLFAYEVWSVWRLLSRLKPSIVHINNGGYPGALSARAAAVGAKLAGVPAVVMVVNNLAVGYTTLFRWLDYLPDRAVVRAVDQFVTGSTAASARLRDVLHLPEPRSLAIHNGISYRPATATPQETRRLLGLETFDGVIFGCVGVLGPRKGHQILLDAIAQLIAKSHDAMPRFKIIVVGDGPLRSALEQRVHEAGLDEYCLFVGERDDVMNYMTLFDVLVLPSTMNEDFPFVVLEAMSHGKPVIASRVAGTVEQVVHRGTGILVEPGATEQLAAAMYEVASCQRLREEFGEAGRQRFLSHFTSEMAVSRYLSLYAELAS